MRDANWPLITQLRAARTEVVSGLPPLHRDRTQWTSDVSDASAVARRTRGRSGAVQHAEIHVAYVWSEAARPEFTAHLPVSCD